MKKYSVGPGALKWTQNYLSHRTQYVVLGRAESRMAAITRGVPQGSVIGPLLYAVFLNEMTEVIKDPTCPDQSHLDRRQLFGKQCRLCGSLVQYADDSTYVIGGRSRVRNQSLLRINLDRIADYLHDNQLVLNPLQDYPDRDHDRAEARKDARRSSISNSQG